MAINCTTASLATEDLLHAITNFIHGYSRDSLGGNLYDEREDLCGGVDKLCNSLWGFEDFWPSSHECINVKSRGNESFTSGVNKYLFCICCGIRFKAHNKLIGWVINYRTDGVL